VIFQIYVHVISLFVFFR